MLLFIIILILIIIFPTNSLIIWLAEVDHVIPFKFTLKENFESAKKFRMGIEYCAKTIFYFVVSSQFLFVCLFDWLLGIHFLRTNILNLTHIYR